MFVYGRAMLLCLFAVVTLRLFGSSDGVTVLGARISLPAILTSSSPTCIVYSCFLENENERDLGSAKESCCRGVVEVWSAENENDSGGLFPIELHERCMLEMAKVPPSISNKIIRDETAQFSWIVSKTFDSTVKPTPTASIEQYLWTNSANVDRLQRDAVQTTTPYHRTRIHSTQQRSTPSIASRIDSHLSKDGGMHRLFHHSFPVLGNTNEEDKDSSYFLYLTIPQGMFIDLDDPIESTTGTVQLAPTEGIDGSHVFVVTTTTTTTTKEPFLVQSFRARLHAATVCDIEQPAFVSGQHLLVWEIDRIQTEGQGDNTPLAIEFATKVHLRYPHPSATLQQWIDLPNPLLFASPNSSLNDDTTTTGAGAQDYKWGLEFGEKVWVAAGKDEDYDWIMGLTISFCLIGVGIMLRDVSRVSLWDDV